MGRYASTELFYGVVISPKQSIALIKKAGLNLKDIKDNYTSPPESFDEVKDNFYLNHTALELAGKKLGFKAVLLGTEGYEESWIGNGIACHVITNEEGSPKKVNIPNGLDAKWEKIASNTGIKKKPSWMMWSSYD